MYDRLTQHHTQLQKKPQAGAKPRAAAIRRWFLVPGVAVCGGHWDGLRIIAITIHASCIGRRDEMEFYRSLQREERSGRLVVGGACIWLTRTFISDTSAWLNEPHSDRHTLFASAFAP